MGKASKSAPRDRMAVPRIQGQMPPSVIILRGGSVRNSQDSAGKPCQSRNAHTPTRASTLAAAMHRSSQNMAAWRQRRERLEEMPGDRADMGGAPLIFQS